MSTGFFRGLVAGLAASAAGLVSPAVGAATKSECAAAYEETQSLQRDGKLTAARSRALFCAQDACPRVVRADCSTWLGEIETSLPSVVFAVIGPGGQETASAQVLLDGQPLAGRTDGKAVLVDPGEHRFRFEVPDAAPIERTLVLREGEKLRTIKVSFATAKPPPPVQEAPPPAGTPVAPFILGGFAVASLGVGATFGGLGLSEKADLEQSCAPACTADRVDSVRTKLLVADIAVAAGAVALGAATLVYMLTRPGRAAPAQEAASGVRIGAAAAPGGGFAALRLRF